MFRLFVVGTLVVVSVLIYHDHNKRVIRKLAGG